MSRSATTDGDRIDALVRTGWEDLLLDRRTLLLGLGAATATACLPKIPEITRPRGELRTLITEWKGRHREALLWIPGTLRPGAPAPLVLAMHGSGGTGEVMLARNGWARTCTEQGWYGLFPTTPRAGPTDDREDQQDEHAYLLFMLDEAMRRVHVARERVYLVGFSGGGQRAYALAAKASDRFAAIGVVATKIGEDSGQPSPDWSPRTHRANRLSILHIHGARDHRTPLEGAPFRGARAVPMFDGLALWAGWIDAALVRDPHIPAPAPARVYGRMWRSPGGHQILGLVDPELEHRWPAWANPTIVSFFQRVPPAGTSV